MGRRNEHSREELRDLALRAAGDIVAESGAARVVHARSRAPHRLYRRRAVHRLRRTSTTSSCTSTSRPSSSCAPRSSASAAAPNQPAQNLRLLVAAYLGFALLHTARWRLVFEHRLPEGQKAPPTYAGHTAAIFALVERRLREAGITRDAASTAELATALWSGAHGICMLAVTGKLQVATQASVQRLLDVLLDRFLR